MEIYYEYYSCAGYGVGEFPKPLELGRIATNFD